MNKNYFFTISIFMICIILFNSYIQSYKYLEPLTSDRKGELDDIILNIMNDKLIKELIKIWLPNDAKDSYNLNNYVPIKDKIIDILSHWLKIINEIQKLRDDNSYNELIQEYNENENNDFIQYQKYLQDNKELSTISFSDDFKKVVKYILNYSFSDNVTINAVLKKVDIKILNTDSTINGTKLKELYEKIKKTRNNIIIDNYEFYNSRIYELAAGVRYNEILSYINNNDSIDIETINDEITYVSTTMTFV